MGGILNSDTDSTTAGSTNGAQTTQGPAVVSNLGNTNRSVVTINNEITDHGAIAAAAKTVTDVVKDIVSLGTSFTQSNEYVTGKVIDSNRATVQDAFDYGKDVFKIASDTVNKGTIEALDFGRESLDLAQSSVSAAIASNNSITKEAFYQSEKTIDLARDLNRENTEFLGDTVRTVSSTLSSNTNQVIESLGEIEEERTLQNTEVLNSVKHLAETVQTGGENIGAEVNKFMVLGALALAGFVTWRLAK